MDGLTQEEREIQGKMNSELDMSDFQNLHVRVSPTCCRNLVLNVLTVPIYDLRYYEPSVSLSIYPTFSESSFPLAVISFHLCTTTGPIYIM